MAARAPGRRGGRAWRLFSPVTLVVVGAAVVSFGALLVALQALADMTHGKKPWKPEAPQVGAAGARTVQATPRGRASDAAATPAAAVAPAALDALPSPAFRVLPSSHPSPSPPVYNTRQCSCVDDWRARRAAGDGGGSVCTCRGTACPPFVDPPFLTAAVGQDVCSLARATGYNCYATCDAAGKVLWFAEACGGAGQAPCAPLLSTPTATPSRTPSAAATIVVPRTTWEPSAVWDFRGGGCEVLHGERRCYMEDRQGRELCPRFVTPEYLESPPGLPQCRPEHAATTYCTIQCQDGNEEVRWGVHDVEDCHRRENFGNCPPRPSVVPKASFTWAPWSEVSRPLSACARRAAAGGVGAPLANVSVGLLTHEPRSFGDSMATYAANGLLDIVPEFIIYINNRNPDTDAVADKYAALYPGKIRVLGDATNRGIARGLVALTTAARYPYFLFLERDFQLIEPSTCVWEQLAAGVALLQAGEAHVVRYRSRWHAGRPNWAVRFFYGHEDDAFRGRQPNLGCNVHYWVDNPAERWPQYVWRCGADPEMLCSDAFYCNWTNNPQLWSIEWWNREYVSRFDAFLRVSPWEDLESYMNWEPNSWNDRGFVVAQGDGLFKHMDRRNIVHV